MRWILRIVSGVLGLLIVLAAIGFLLPEGFSVQRSAQIKAPPERVYALVSDPREWKRWSVWNQRDPAMKVTYSGPHAGVGAAWAWESQTEGNGSMQFTEAVPGQRLGYRLSFPDFGMQSDGQLLMAAEGDGTRVTWTNTGKMGNNPVNRWFGLFMDKMVGPDFEAGLANLKRLAERG